MQELNLKDIYGLYLSNINEQHVASRYTDDNKSYFHGSGAGLCARKHYYSAYTQVEGAGVDENTNRIFRIGNLLHKDIQDAVTWYATTHGLPLLIEKEIILEDLNVRSFIDLALIDTVGEQHVLYDIKTCNSYKWRGMFGRSPDKNPSVNYQLQLATYGIWAKRHYDLDSITLKICYYNKDNSNMREVEISSEFINEAYNYWSNVGHVTGFDSAGGGNLPVVSLGIAPVYEWECNEKYCRYFDECGGGLKGII